MKKTIVLFCVGGIVASMMADIAPLPRRRDRVWQIRNQSDWENVCKVATPKKVLIRGQRGPLNLTCPVANFSIESIEIADCEIQSLQALSALKGLVSMQIQNCTLSPVSYIPQLPNLMRVELRNMTIKDRPNEPIDLSFLSKSDNLRFFLAEKTAILSFKPMEHACKMEFLSLIDPVEANTIDLAPLICMKNLQHLALPSIRVKNFDVIKCITTITDLDIRDIKGADSLVGFEKFDRLDRLVVTKGQFPPEETEALQIILRGKADQRRSGFGHLIEVPKSAER